MPDTITREPVSFPSTDAKTQVSGYIWQDKSASQPRGVIQIAHGMAEHILRYDEFARFLAENAFIVAGHDHIGHGKSVNDKSQWGCLPAKGGANILVEDMQLMRSLMMSRIPSELPYFVFGHSMGSFVVRSYITKHASGLAGAIICGTGYLPPAKSRSGNLAARLIGTLRGQNYKSKFLDNMGVGAYNKPIENPRTRLDWLSVNEENVDAYIADESSGFMFAAGGYATLTALIGEVCEPACFAKIPAELPLLFISGAEDPVGDMGKGVKKVAKLAERAGVQNIEVNIYSRMRHEILNETDRQLVFDDVLAWVTEHC